MKLKYIFITVVGPLILNSCIDELDVSQPSYITSQSMWVDESDAVAAVNGIYSNLRSALSSNYINWGDYRTGLFSQGIISSYATLNYTITENSGFVDWTSIYTTINTCNLVLKHTPSISFKNNEDKNKVLANAYFVRAFCYYYIARIWGDAPILTTGFESDEQNELFPTRQPTDMVYSQVEKDLEEAVKLMPAGLESRKKASLGSINMLQADYYLWMAKTQSKGNEYLDKADAAIDKVLSNNKFSLSDSYESIFSDEENNEIIFSVNFQRDEFEGGFPSDYLIPLQYILDNDIIENPVKIGSHQQWICLTQDYQDFIYSVPNDNRATTNIMVYTDSINNSTYRWINKYPGEWTSNTRFFTSDIVIYRSAEAILFKAEIQNALGNKANSINQLNIIAKRAYGVDNYYPDTLTKAEVDNAIIDERLKEFVAEGKIWWDYIRFGVVFDRVPQLQGRENDENILLWPVSVTSMNTNPNIKQTPGL